MKKVSIIAGVIAVVLMIVTWLAMPAYFAGYIPLWAGLAAVIAIAILGATSAIAGTAFLNGENAR